MKSQEPQEKKFRELSDDELKQVKGGNIANPLQDYSGKLLGKKYDVNVECTENDQMTIASIPKKDLL